MCFLSLQNQDEDEEVEQITFKILDDPAPKKDKKKKDKKEKKEKKHKKDKKKKKDKHHDSDDEAGSGGDKNKDESESQHADEESTPVVAAPEKKSKFQLQMEAAMKKKGEEAAGAGSLDKATPAPGNSKTLTTAEAIPEVPDKLAGEEEEEEDDEIMYGHKDDVVWTDKSHADKEAEAGATDDDPTQVRQVESNNSLSLRSIVLLSRHFCCMCVAHVWKGWKETE
jgi:hypothetical protein